MFHIFTEHSSKLGRPVAIAPDMEVGTQIYLQKIIVNTPPAKAGGTTKAGDCG